MNRIIHISVFVLVLLSSCFQVQVSAQTFSITPDYVEKSGPGGSYFDANLDVQNLTDKPLALRIQRTKSTLPADWTGSMCTTNNCYPFEAENVEDVIKANATGRFIIDIGTTEAPAQGEIELTISSKVNPSEAYTFRFKVTTTTVGISERMGLPKSLTLLQNYPNPFSQSTTIAFSNPGGNPVTLRVFTMLGREVRTLYADAHVSGTVVATWDGRDNSGRAVATGIYIYKLSSNGTTLSRRMLFSR